MIQNVVIGTQKKLALRIEPIQGVSIKDFKNIEVDYFVSDNHQVHLTKSDLKDAGDENQRLILVDTKEVGVGRLKVRVKVWLPDNDYTDGRLEIYDFTTPVNIVNSLR